MFMECPMPASMRSEAEEQALNGRGQKVRIIFQSLQP